MNRFFSIMAALLFVTACADSPVDVVDTTPGIPQQISANAIALSSDGMLVSVITWTATPPYDRHSVYLGVDGAWEIVVDSIFDGVVGGVGTQTDISRTVDVPLDANDQNGYLCVVAWRQGIFTESCAQVVYPALPGTPSVPSIRFGDMVPPWAAVSVVPSSFKVKVGESADALPVLHREGDMAPFVCADIENGLRGFIKLDILDDNLDSVYIASDYEFYVDLSCRNPTLSSTDTQVVSIQPRDGPINLTEQPTSGTLLASLMR